MNKIMRISSADEVSEISFEELLERYYAFIYDEVTKDVVLLKFTLEDVFDRSKWEKTELPSVIFQQKKRA